MKLSDIALAGGIALGASGAAHAGDCGPESLGLQENIIAATCVVDLQTQVPLSTEFAFSKANVAGRDTGELRTGNTAQVVRGVHALALQNLDAIMQDQGSALIGKEVPRINISGTIRATASPDVNLEGGGLRTANGKSPAYALYRRTPENMLTAQKRCADLMAAIPATLMQGSSKVEVTTNGLNCVPEVLVFDENKWGAALTKLGNDLIDKGVAPSSFDEAQILAIKMANGKSPIPSTLTAESIATIAALTKELEGMRKVPVNGDMSVTIKVNKTEYKWGNIAIGGIMALVIGLALGAYAR